jgi:DNA-binding HxlR family transcriptional regulator
VVTVASPAAGTAAGADTAELWGCPIDKSMGLVGSRSAMLIMREAFYGTTRFDDFVKKVEMAPATASTHLRTLTEAGLLRRQPYREPGGRTRDEYTVTEAGSDFRPVVFALFEWGRKHAGINPLVAFSHAGCGEPVEVQLRCAAGHPVGEDDITWRPVGPAAEAPAGAAG